MVWYLVLLLVGDSGSIAIPQTDHAQCIQNQRLKDDPSVPVYRSFCVTGAPGFQIPGTKTKSQDDDD